MDSTCFNIGELKVGTGARPFIIAEIAQSHEGSLGMAHAYVDAVADAGADAIKFQTHIASEESTLDESFRIRFSRQDATRYEYWKRMEFSEEAWAGLSQHARKRNIIFFSSPFSVAAVELLMKVEVPVWKVGSGELFNEELLFAITQNKAPIILSTGMSTFKEIEESVEQIKKTGVSFALLQCTSNYPVSIENVGLNVIAELRRRFNCPVGLSDHSGEIFPALAALAKGANIIEVHVVFDKRMFGPDTMASITLEQLRFLVEARDAFWAMETHPVNKDELATSFTETKQIFTRSLAPNQALQAGTVLQEAMLTLKKPGTGIPPNELKNIVGRRLKRNVTPDRILRWEDVDA